MNNFSRARLLLPTIALGLGACGAADNTSANAPASNATPPAEIKPATIEPANVAAAVVGDPKRGKILFLQCTACHALDASEGHKVGPNLSGLLGAVVGSKEGFNYSPTLTDADAVWTEDSLQAFLAKPSDYYPGTIMAFGGIAKATDRAAVVAYIKKRTAE